MQGAGAHQGRRGMEREYRITQTMRYLPAPPDMAVWIVWNHRGTRHDGEPELSDVACAVVFFIVVESSFEGPAQRSTWHDARGKLHESYFEHRVSQEYLEHVQEVAEYIRVMVDDPRWRDSGLCVYELGEGAYLHKDYALDVLEEAQARWQTHQKETHDGAA